MTEAQKQTIMSYLLREGDFRKELEIPHHLKTTVFRHSVNVARYSLKLANKYHITVNETDLFLGAILHDYFLYNWHDKRSHEGVHGFTHAKIAADKARKDYLISKKVYNIIYSHMFPLNITHIPRSKEAWIVLFADKVIALREILSIPPNFSLTRESKHAYF